MKKKLALMTSALMAISLLAGCNSHSHDWGEVIYTWSSDNSTCTAERVCKSDESHKETETANSTYNVVVEAKCEENGSGRYTVTFTNEAFTAQTKDVTLEAIGHEWGTPTYTWSDDYSTCTATRVCKNDSNHIESETAFSAYTVTLSPTCDEEGTGVYDVAFENEAFEVQTHEVTLPATGHEWGAITYAWADDNSTCTARRVCAHDATHIDTETVNSTYKVVEEAKCEEDGKGRYTADFTKEAFVDQTKDITLEAIGHNLTAHDAHGETCKKAGNSAYWSCERCGKFFSDAEGKNEIENGSWIIPAHAHDLIHNDAKAASCYVPGNIEYWVCKECFQYFSDEACEHPIDQEDVRTPAHHTLTAHDAHAETCTEAGNSAYWRCERCDKFFSDAEGKNEIENDSWIIPAKNHSWGTPTYTWSADNSTCTATRVCANDESHKETETVDSVYTVVTPATEISEGLGKYTVEFTKSEFVTQEKEITLDKLPYLGRTPILSEDGKTLTYGLYPQTNVDDSTLVSALNALTTPETNGWYLYNNEYYAKVSATPNNSRYVFDNGTKIVNGTTYWFKCEPITWNILSNNDGECYLLSSVLLDAHCYYNSTSTRTIDGQTIYANNHEYSDIRTWINNDFYNSAFALGNEHILTTTVDNSASTTDSSSNSYACNNTQDIVFLPSYQDYINSSYGFSTSTSSTNTRYCRTTDWARARGAWYSTSSSSLYNGYYWTRSPDSGYSYGAWYVNDVGRLISNDVDYTYYSVRPAISIKIAQFTKQ